MRILLLGSTGSIGTQTLEIIREHRDKFEVVGLVAGKNEKLFEEQKREFQPKHAVLAAKNKNCEKEIEELINSPRVDLVVNAISGVAGLMPTLAACNAGKTIALANKESIVMAGELIAETAKKTGARILPIDSEISAIWQSLESGPQLGVNTIDSVEKIILTASGGPFYGMKKAELAAVTPAQAVAHPTWKMGAKISVDSATLMNKAFEIIETAHIFGIPPEKISAVIHRQSVVHALVQFRDGNTRAILGAPDMRIPISYALFYALNPYLREANNFPRADFESLNLTFEKPDYSLFKGPKMAYEVLKKGGIMPAAFCLADEIAVRKFLAGEIPFLGIYDFIEAALAKVKNEPLNLQSLSELQSKILRNIVCP